MADGSTKTCFTMIRIVSMLVFICHVMACLWVLVGRTGAQAGKVKQHEQTSMDIYFTLGWLTCVFRIVFVFQENWLDHFFGFEPEDTVHGLSVSRVYLAAYYYCFTTMTGVGYGDITPQSDRERGFAICLEGVGGFTYAFIIGSLTVLTIL